MVPGPGDALLLKAERKQRQQLWNIHENMLNSQLVAGSAAQNK